MTGTTDTNTLVATSNPSRRLDASAQVAILAVLWFGYAAVRNLVGDTRLTALGNASRLLQIETSLGLDIEEPLQSAITWPAAFVAANSYYLLHFPLTLAVMVFAFWYSRATVFPVLRNSLIGSTGVALIAHLAVPMAPPRMLPGFVDAGAAFGPDPYSIAGSESANQFAAMPSMHVAWAILSGYTIWQLSSRQVVRSAAVFHPMLTSVVVVVTGHHFVSDVAIGAAVAIVSISLAKSNVPFSERATASEGDVRRSLVGRQPAPNSSLRVVESCRSARLVR